MKNSQMPEEMKEIHKWIGLASQIGAAMVVSILMGFGLGFWLDKQLHFHFVCTISGIILGVVLGFYYMFHLVSRLDEKS